MERCCQNFLLHSDEDDFQQSDVSPEQYTQNARIGRQEVSVGNDIMMLLSEFASMWVGSLRMITTVKHRIDQQPDSRSAFHHPYRAELNTRIHGGQETDRILKEGLIEPTMSEWATSVVFAPKKAEKLRFCVDYRMLTAMMVQVTYPSPRMEECTDSLRDSTIFSTIDYRSGYYPLL